MVAGPAAIENETEKEEGLSFFFNEPGKKKRMPPPAGYPSGGNLLQDQVASVRDEISV